jgi:hypothetical protein
VMRVRNPQKPVAAIVDDLAAAAADLGPVGKDSTFGWGLLNAASLCPDGKSEPYQPAASEASSER